MTEHILRSEGGVDALHPRQLPPGSTQLCVDAALALRLVQALTRQKIDPLTEITMAPASFFFNELEVENCLSGRVRPSEHPDQPFWTVEAFVATSHFSQLCGDETERTIADAFIDAHGSDGLVLERTDIRIWPTCLKPMHVNVVEIPEGSWGAAGQKYRYGRDQQADRSHRTSRVA